MPPPTSVPAPTRFRRYLTIILRWLLITVTVFSLTALIGVYITDHWLRKVYTAAAQIEMIPRAGEDASELESHSDRSDDPLKVQAEFIEAQFSIMQSSDFLLPVIYDLDLDKAWAKRVFKSKEDALSADEALTHMHQMLKLDAVRGTDILRITVSSDVPQETARIANAIADRYKTMRDNEEDERNQRGEDSLREQIAQQQQVVEEKKAVLAKLPHPLTTNDLAAQRDLEQQQSLLDALNVRLKQVMADSQLPESPVRIVARAMAPDYPSKPNKALCFMVTFVLAGFLSLAAASFVEIVFLLSRASERTDN